MESYFRAPFTRRGREPKTDITPTLGEKPAWGVQSICREKRKSLIARKLKLDHAARQAQA
jgi:hypothetical protein